MVQNNIGIVIVVVQSIDSQTPAGIITEKDIVRDLAESQFDLIYSKPANEQASSNHSS
jgi:CBS domain-containing protein